MGMMHGRDGAGGGWDGSRSHAAAGVPMLTVEKAEAARVSQTPWDSNACWQGLGLGGRRCWILPT